MTGKILRALIEIAKIRIKFFIPEKRKVLSIITQ